MISDDQPISSYGVLLKALDDTLATGKFNGDVKKTAEIALELCDLIRLELDPEQLAAVETAKRFWNDGGFEQERLCHLEDISARMKKTRLALRNLREAWS